MKIPKKIFRITLFVAIVLYVLISWLIIKLANYNIIIAILLVLAGLFLLRYIEDV